MTQAGEIRLREVEGERDYLLVEQQKMQEDLARVEAENKLLKDQVKMLMDAMAEATEMMQRLNVGIENYFRSDDDVVGGT